MTTDIRAALVKHVAKTLATEVSTHEDWETWASFSDAALTTLSAKLSELGLRIVPAKVTAEMREEIRSIGGNVSVAWLNATYPAALAASPDPLATDAPVEGK